MALRNYGKRAKRLLRFAPWCDLNELREDFAQKLLEELAEYPENYSTIAKNRIINFAAGNRPIVANSQKFRDLLAGAIAVRYRGTYHMDPLYGQAVSELHNYFLVTDRKLGLES